MNFSKFDYCISPPPCYYTQVEHIRPINQVIFNQNTKLCMIIDSHFQTQIFDYSGRNVLSVFLSEDPKVRSIANVGRVDWPEIYAVTITLETDVDLCIGYENNGFNQTYILKDCLNEEKADKEQVSMRDIISKFYYTMKTATGSFTYCFWLTATRDLYVEDRIVCRQVTSYNIHQNYLMFTRPDSFLYTVRLTDPTLLEQEFNLERLYKRSVELGTRILAVSEDLPPSIILEHPRGNLEITGDDMISIDYVDRLLDRGEWARAMAVMEDETINWNVLVELNPRRVLSSIKEFVFAANERGYGLLATIMQELNPKECFLNTTYKNMTRPVVEPMSVKTDLINAVLAYLIKTDCVIHLSNIVAIQRRYISLRTAMKSIINVFHSEHPLLQFFCQDAVGTLLTSDTKRDVLNTAYNLHDLSFVLLVHETTGEDPRLYEDEIARLEGIRDEAKLKFEMCLKGNNPNDAVKYLLRYDYAEKEYLENFIKLHNLEKVAYNNVDICHLYYFNIVRLYAESLSNQCNYQEAAHVYMRASLFREALNEYILSLDWREVIRLMTVLEYDDAMKQRILDEIADNLINENRALEAVVLLQYHNKNYKKTINILVKFKRFRQAVCLAESMGLNEELREYFLFFYISRYEC
nr:unnamed protein product [Callosobruchus analis]